VVIIREGYYCCVLFGFRVVGESNGLESRDRNGRAQYANGWSL